MKADLQKTFKNTMFLYVFWTSAFGNGAEKRLRKQSRNSLKLIKKSNDSEVENAIIFGDDGGTPNFEILGSFLASISEPSWCQVGAKLARSRPKLGLEAALSVEESIAQGHSFSEAHTMQNSFFWFCRPEVKSNI